MGSGSTLGSSVGVGVGVGGGGVGVGVGSGVGVGVGTGVAVGAGVAVGSEVGVGSEPQASPNARVRAATTRMSGRNESVNRVHNISGESGCRVLYICAYVLR